MTYLRKVEAAFHNMPTVAMIEELKEADKVQKLNTSEEFERF